jgi:Zn-dependent protease with chaperone function
MNNKYVELFLELYNYGLKRRDSKLQSIANFLLYNQGPLINLVIVGTFDDKFVKKYNIDTIALSLGVTLRTPTFIIPMGVILIHEGFKQAPEEWIRFTIAHELGHIYLNHFPINVIVIELWKLIPPELRNLWIIIKEFIYYLNWPLQKRFLEEEIIAQKELKADEWAVMVLGEKWSALSFLNWVKKQGITISHLSPFGKLPALTIDERIKNIERLKI